MKIFSIAFHAAVLSHAIIKLFVNWNKTVLVDCGLALNPHNKKRSDKYLFTPVLDSEDMKRIFHQKLDIGSITISIISYIVFSEYTSRNNAIAKAGASRD